jgi:hypothetical protein
LEAKIKTVIREHHFSPAQVGDFYLDRIDYSGLYWYYDDVVAVMAQMKKKQSKK